MGESQSKVYVCDQVQAVRDLHFDLLTSLARQSPIADQLGDQAQRILEAHRVGNRAVVTHLQCWHPSLVGQPDESIMRFSLTLNDARESLAREYGFQDWKEVESLGAERSDVAFESAVDALLQGDKAGLRLMLKENPGLAQAKSQFGHRSTLLHYVAANGVETHRQVVPENLVELTKVILAAGADVNAEAEMYGGGSTTIGLLITSAHPAEAGVMDAMVKVLVEAGAETDGS